MTRMLAQILIELIKIRRELEFWHAFKGPGSYDQNMGYHSKTYRQDSDRIDELTKTHLGENI